MRAFLFDKKKAHIRTIANTQSLQIFCKRRPKCDSENTIDCKKRPCTQFLNRCLLHVINSLFLTAKSDSLLDIHRLRLGFPYVYDNANDIQPAVYQTPSPIPALPPLMYILYYYWIIRFLNCDCIDNSMSSVEDFFWSSSFPLDILDFPFDIRHWDIVAQDMERVETTNSLHSLHPSPVLHFNCVFQ